LEVVHVSETNIGVRTGMSHVALVGGRIAVVRAATAADVGTVGLLHDACSPATLRHRYLGSAPRLSPQALTSLVTPPGGLALVACAGGPDGEPLGMAQVAGGQPVAEIAVLVRDDHQGRGLGTILARDAIEAARLLGYRELVVFGAAGNTALSRLLIRLGLRRYAQFDGAVMTVRAPLDSGVGADVTRPLAVC
jgi:GNAT superfamily N-acetyltransferase